MPTHKINVKLYATDDGLPLDAFVPVFHGWIQQQSVPDHLLVDVTDYAHVPNGPGTVLVSHEANFYTDRYDGRLGLMYSRKTPAPGGFEDQLRQATTAALDACVKLEQEPSLGGKLRFRRDEMQIRFNDRLNAPNTAQTFESVRPQIESFCQRLTGQPPAEIKNSGDPRGLMTINVRLSKPIS